MNDNNSNYSLKENNVSLTGDNFEVWYTIIYDALYMNKLNIYIDKDVLKELEEKNSNSDELENAKIENKKARLFILNSIGSDIIKDVIKLESAYSLIKYLKGEYGESETYMLYWDKKIADLKAKTIKDIPKILTKLDNIFENMKKSKFPISDKEKSKYAYNTFPPGFRSKFEFNVNE
ncbi:hypothetical protein LY90DRAFT_506778 [Neocallimastix californiae]|uniref:DUF4219 domain-containing protein n=1 Tax=Neocallimastix californiae TaxID=1754190 RepID=A0A1Y2DB82_9FUNG|nr:hypothetical protein LY90DRAFT_506778 [Neocallimastix californiae]|eukprot:ORY56522.1 hypothetical protein LY90DRAFT_506778 [Neocallimastix californiae]